jgi:cytochrome c oxidase cbb3-type subunit 3
MSKKPVKKTYETTGHEWDGIEELNTPLPRWWLWTFYACIVWGIGYTIAYPAWPLVSSATQGILGNSAAGDTRLAVAAEIERYAAANEEIETKLANAELTEISADAELNGFAVNAGAAVFRTWCAQCHGSGAAGAVGYPNLLDNAWLWGGDIESIYLTIKHGIRNEDDGDARYSEMPRFGADEILEPAQIDQVVQYVLQMSGQEHDAALATEGETVFLDNCAACHMEDGTGDIYQGAPNLTDSIWLYGGDVAALTETVTYSRYGVMPSWSYLGMSEPDIRAVSIYVHQLGGGE